MKKVLYDIDLTSYINDLVIKDIVTLHDDADILIPISTILNIYVID